MGHKSEILHHKQRLGIIVNWNSLGVRKEQFIALGVQQALKG
jgi:hypothetical protein